MVLCSFRLFQIEILSPGGNKTLITKRLEDLFREREWSEKQVRSRLVIEEGIHFGKRHE